MTTKLCTKCNSTKELSEFYYIVKKDKYEAHCKECISIYRKKYREQNKESISKNLKQWRENNINYKRDMDRVYRENNIEKLKEYKKQYHAKNKEKIIEKSKIWYESNIERAKETRKKYNKYYRSTESSKISSRIFKLKRRKVIRYGCDKATNTEIKLLIENSKNCYWCDKELNGIYHIDHYIPIAKGGNHSIENLVISCPSCNLRKHSKDPMQFAKEIGKIF